METENARHNLVVTNSLHANNDLPEERKSGVKLEFQENNLFAVNNPEMMGAGLIQKRKAGDIRDFDEQVIIGEIDQLSDGEALNPETQL